MSSGRDPHLRYPVLMHLCADCSQLDQLREEHRDLRSQVLSNAQYLASMRECAFDMQKPVSHCEAARASFAPQWLSCARPTGRTETCSRTRERDLKLPSCQSWALASFRDVSAKAELHELKPNDRCPCCPWIKAIPRGAASYNDREACVTEISSRASTWPSRSVWR